MHRREARKRDGPPTWGVVGSLHTIEEEKWVMSGPAIVDPRRITPLWKERVR